MQLLEEQSSTHTQYWGDRTHQYTVRGRLWVRMSEKEVRERVCAHLGEGNLNGRYDGMREYVHKQENECARGSI